MSDPFQKTRILPSSLFSSLSISTRSSTGEPAKDTEPIPPPSGYDRNEPFEGWRVWRVYDWQRGKLSAAHMGYIWEGPVLSVPERQIAGLPKGEGFHAFRTRKGAVEYLVGLGGYALLAFGKVRMYGMVVEYEHGFRSSKVIVDRLYVSPIWGEAFRKRLAERYQCSVTAWTEKKEPAPEPQKPWWKRWPPWWAFLLPVGPLGVFLLSIPGDTKVFVSALGWLGLLATVAVAGLILLSLERYSDG